MDSILESDNRGQGGSLEMLSLDLVETWLTADAPLPIRRMGFALTTFTGLA